MTQTAKRCSVIGAVFLFLATAAFAGTGADSNATPSVPSNASTKSQIQSMQGWDNCTACAAIGGHGATAPVSMAQFQKSPSLSGSSAKFTIGGSRPYANALWWKALGAENSASNFQYQADVYFTDPQAAEAVEFDTTQATGHAEFILGIQCNIKGGGVWDVFNTGGNKWESTGVACTAPAAYTWHHLTYQGKRTGSTTTVVSITWDGVTHYVNKTFPNKPYSGSGLSASFQLDLDSKPTPYSAWVDNMTLKFW
jgi:hypothetical protein